MPLAVLERTVSTGRAGRQQAGERLQQGTLRLGARRNPCEPAGSGTAADPWLQTAWGEQRPFQAGARSCIRGSKPWLAGLWRRLRCGRLLSWSTTPLEAWRD